MTDQLTKRLYYACPIQALYMMKEFRVELTTLQGDKYWKKGKKDILVDLEGDAHGDSEYLPKYYIALESEAIFEPREGDIVDRDDPIPHQRPYKATLGDTKAFRHGNWSLRIMEREGKLFFMPTITK